MNQNFKTTANNYTIKASLLDEEIQQLKEDNKILSIDVQVLKELIEETVDAKIEDVR